MTALTLENARTIVSTALALGREKGFQPLAVLVLDAGGHPKAFEREDRASIGRFAVANGKAMGALNMGMGSRAIAGAAAARPEFVNAINGAFGGALIPVPGGVLVADSDGEIIGAVGVSGDNSDNDELAAVAGIEAAGLVAHVGQMP